MNTLRRGLVLLATTLPALGLVVWLLLAPSQLAHADLARPVLTPTVTPTPTPQFSATLTVMPDRQRLLLGETLIVTLNLTVDAGCQYPFFEVTLNQTGHNVPAFAYINPISATVVGSTIQMPFTYTLQAIAPGYVTLSGRLFGEKNCDGAWVWAYVQGLSPSIKVEPWPYSVWLPAIGAGLPEASETSTISRRLERRELLQLGPPVHETGRITMNRRVAK